MDAYDIVALIITLINLLIFVPILIYSLYLFDKYSKEGFFKYRSKSLVFTINILGICGLLIERPYTCFLRVWQIVDLPIWTIYHLVAITIWGCYYMLAIKSFLLYYKQQFSSSIIDITWKQDINSKTYDFYIINKDRWGNAHFLLKIVLIVLILANILDSILAYYLGEGIYFDIIHSTMGLIPISFCYYIYYKAKDIDDIYKIREEIYYTLIWLTVLFIIAAIFFGIYRSLCYLFLAFYKAHENTFIRFEWTFYLPLASIVYITIPAYSSLYPVYQYKKMQNEDRIGAVQLDNINSSDHDIKQYTILNAIADESIFKLFMQYLLKQFATENLLFLVELCQIKYSLQRKYDNTIKILKQPLTAENTEMYDNDTDKYMIIDYNVFNHDNHIVTHFVPDGKQKLPIKIPCNIPQSEILVNNKTFNDQIIKLFSKYIKHDSKFELNISYSVKKRLIEYFDTFIETNSNDCDNINNECDRFNVLDECSMEILCLIQGTFTKFQSTENYRKLLVKLKEENR